MKRMGIVRVPNKKAVQEILDTEASKSSKMKALFDLGLEVKHISEIMGVRYNFVYNVVSNYCNMEGIPVEAAKKESKKDQIIEMHKAGAEVKAISIELKAHANYVYNTIKLYKMEQEAKAAKVEEEGKAKG